MTPKVPLLKCSARYSRGMILTALCTLNFYLAYNYIHFSNGFRISILHFIIFLLLIYYFQLNVFCFSSYALILFCFVHVFVLFCWFIKRHFVFSFLFLFCSASFKCILFSFDHLYLFLFLLLVFLWDWYIMFCSFCETISLLLCNFFLLNFVELWQYKHLAFSANTALHNSNVESVTDKEITIFMVHILKNKRMFK